MSRPPYDPYAPKTLGEKANYLLDTDNDKFDFIKGFIEDWNDSTYEQELISWLQDKQL